MSLSFRRYSTQPYPLTHTPRAEGRTYRNPFQGNQRASYGTLCLSNGDRYVDWIMNDAPLRGLGETLARDGSRHIGMYVNGKQNTFRERLSPEGIHYTGFFSDDMTPRWGVLQNRSGSQYTGPILNGKGNGIGVHTSPCGTRFLGRFIDDIPQGLGEIQWPNGEYVRGEFDHGVFFRSFEDSLDKKFPPLTVRMDPIANGAALIVRPSSSNTLAFSSLREVEHLGNELAQIGYPVYVRKAQSLQEIEDTMAQLSQAHQIQILWLQMHGNRKHVKSEKDTITAKALQPSLKRLGQNPNIFLDSCCTGADSEGDPCMAREILTYRPDAKVIAPSHDTIVTLATCHKKPDGINPDLQIKMYTEDGVRAERLFQKENGNR